MVVRERALLPAILFSPGGRCLTWKSEGLYVFPIHFFQLTPGYVFTWVELWQLHEGVPRQTFKLIRRVVDADVHGWQPTHLTWWQMANSGAGCCEMLRDSLITAVYCPFFAAAMTDEVSKSSSQRSCLWRNINKSVKPSLFIPRFTFLNCFAQFFACDRV